MCDTQSRVMAAATDVGSGEGGGGVSTSFAASPSRASRAGRATRARHPYGRRNTYIGTYTRQALGFATAERDENLLTTKFRNLPSRERRLYTLTLGYGLRDDGKSGLGGGGGSNKRQRSEMSRGHAVALMARLQEMLLHGGRTVEGIFAALRLDTRYATLSLCYGTAVCLHVSVFIYVHSTGRLQSCLPVGMIRIFYLSTTTTFESWASARSQIHLSYNSSSERKFD